MVTSYTPRTFNYGTGVDAAFSGGTVALTEPTYALGGALLPPGIWRNASTTTTYASGLYLALTGDGSNVHVDLFDLSTLTSLYPLHGGNILRAALVGSYAFCGAVALQRSRPGYLFWLSDGPVAATSTVLYLGLNGYYDVITPAYRTLGVVLANDTALNTALCNTHLICDISILPRSQTIEFFVANGSKSAGNAQLHLVRVTPTLNLTGTIPTTETAVIEWSKEFVAASYTPWTGRPDTCLTCQAFTNPDIPYAVALLGNYELAATIAHVRVTSPRLAILDLNGNIIGGADGGKGSHVNAGAGVRAHGMCLSPDGYIYTVGTGSLVGAAGNPLIERFHYTDLSANDTTKYKSVAFDANDLGGNFGSAGDTHVLYPMFTGQHLIVIDEGTTNTRAFAFTKDLTFIRQWTLSSTAATGFTRFRGGNKGISFLGSMY